MVLGVDKKHCGGRPSASRVSGQAVFRQCGSFGHAELIDGLLRINLSGLQHHGREIGAVGTVGEMLCLEAEG